MHVVLLTFPCHNNFLYILSFDWINFKSNGSSLFIKTTPIPFPEASHSTIKVFVKSGVAKTGARHVASLRCSKALVASVVHENASFFNNVVRGASILP